MFWAEHTLFSTDGLVWSRPLVFFWRFFQFAFDFEPAANPGQSGTVMIWLPFVPFSNGNIRSEDRNGSGMSSRGHDGCPFKVSWVWFSWVQLFFFVSKREQVSALRSTQRCPGQCFFSERSRTAPSQHKMQISSSRSATNLADYCDQ